MYNTVNTKDSITEKMILNMSILYLIFLVWAVLFKCGAPYLGDGAERVINLIPFNHNLRYELNYNIALFIPFGFCLGAIKQQRGVIKLIAAVISISILLEMVQFILALGRSDITDLLMNTIGGIIGIGFFYLLTALFGKQGRKAVFIVCLLLTLFVIYASISFIFFNQLNLGYTIVKL